MSTSPSPVPFHLASVAVLDTPELTGVFDSIERIGRANLVELFGDDDLADSAEVLRINYLDQADATKLMLVAVEGAETGVGERDATGLPVLTASPTGAVLGYATIRMAVRDNLDSAELEVQVHPDARRRGVGAALAAAVEAEVRASGRHVLMSWSGHRDEVEADDPEALLAPTGVGALRASDPVVTFARTRGYELEQTERHSMLALPVPAEILDAQRAKAAAASTGYRLLTWVGATPPEHRDGMARLRNRMSVDVPMGALAFEEEVWDAERVVRQDERNARAGYTVLTAVAQHEESGRLVAYTTMIGPRANPAVVWQGDTLVHGEHRGHRLGLAVKVANLDQLTRERPSTRRIHTWNAGENEWMLAINIALGFVRVATEGAWQRRLDPTPSPAREGGASV